MSAWLVSQTHVAAIVTYAADYAEALGLAPLDPNELGALLWTENGRSLRYRYESSWAESWPELPILGQLYDHRRVLVDRLCLLKQLDCFDYQACETPDYATTPAAKAVELVRRHIMAALNLTPEFLERLPGFARAPWGLDDPEDADAERETISQNRLRPV